MLKAGAACLDITPPLGTPMPGLFHERRAEAIHDPLLVRSFALERDGEGIAVAVCDLIGVKRLYLDRAKAQIARTTGLSPNRVLISCTHTHTGAQTGDDAYTASVIRRISDAVRLAWEGRQPAEQRGEDGGPARGLGVAGTDLPFEAVHHMLRGERSAVVEAHPSSQPERPEEAVPGHRPLLRQGRLDVTAAVRELDEGVEDLPGDQRHGSVESGGRIQLRRQRVEPGAKHAALGQHGRRAGDGEDQGQRREPEAGEGHGAVIRRNAVRGDGEPKIWSSAVSFGRARRPLWQQSRPTRAVSRASASGGNHLPREDVQGGESDRRAAKGCIGKSSMNSIALNHESGPIRLTSLETASYTELALGVHARDVSRWGERPMVHRERNGWT